MILQVRPVLVWVLGISIYHFLFRFYIIKEIIFRNFSSCRICGKTSKMARWLYYRLVKTKLCLMSVILFFIKYLCYSGVRNILTQIQPICWSLDDFPPNLKTLLSVQVSISMMGSGAESVPRIYCHVKLVSMPTKCNVWPNLESFRFSSDHSKLHLLQMVW